MKVTVKDNQTILDIALEHYGTADGISEILNLNPTLTNDSAALIQQGISPGDLYLDVMIKPGTILLVDENSRMVQKNTVKEIDDDITTYEHGTDN